MKSLQREWVIQSLEEGGEGLIRSLRSRGAASAEGEGSLSQPFSNA